MNDFAETVPGSYCLVKMPDGAEVMMHRLDNGQWVTTAERATADPSFTDRFKDTDFAPTAQTPATTEAVRPNTSAVTPYTATKNHIDTFIGEVLGDPDFILARDPLAMERVAKLRERPQHMRHVLGLIRILGPSHYKWQMVQRIIERS